MKWPEHEISKITNRFISGGTPNTKNQEYWKGDIPWITGADILDGEVTLGRRFINKSAVEESATNIIPAGSILMVTRTGVGKIAIAPIDIAISQDITGIVIKKGIIPKFVISAINLRMSILLAAQRGATIKGITRNDLKQLKIPLPATSEQCRIVEILDQADCLRKLRADADDKARRILPALFIKMFGDPATNPMEWEVKPLGDLSVCPPQYGANAKAIDYLEKFPRYVRITDIANNGRLRNENVKTIDMDNWEPYKLADGDLLFARSGATVGKTYMYRPQDGLCVFAGYLIRFKLDLEQLEPWVAFAFTHTSYYQSWIASKKRAAAQPNINGQEYAALPMIRPEKNLQKKFAKVAERTTILTQQNLSIRDKINNLFESIRYFAFAGDLTASWRKAHMKELLQEMEVQAKALAS